MRLPRRIPWMSLLVVGLLGGAAVAGAVAPGSYIWKEPQPPITSVSNLARMVRDAKVGLNLEPPGSAVRPAVSGRDAAANAWREEGAPGHPKGVHVNFALLTWGDRFTKTPVWVVTYEGGDCIPAAGEPGTTPSCAAQAFHTIIDATTGQYIASYTSPDSEDL